MKKTVFRPAPLLATFLAVAFGIGLCMAAGLRCEWGALAAFLIFAIGAVAALRLKNKALPILLFILAAAAFGVYRYSVWLNVPADDIRNLNGREVELFGGVSSEIQSKGDRQRFDFDADSVRIGDENFDAGGSARVYLYRARSVAYGDRLALSCTLEEPRSATNPFAFDFQKSLSMKGIGSIAFVRGDRKVDFLEKGHRSLYGRVVEAIRRHVARTIHLGLDGNEAALLEGLMLGRGRDLPKDVRAAFVDSGTVHILAVSGLHVGLIAGLLWLVFATIFQLKRPFAALITIACLAIYVGVVGGRPSVLRASIMFSIILFGQVLQRPSNLLNSIGAAGLILLVINPVWLADIGFQLSFGATLGIAFLLPYFDEWVPASAVRSNFLRKWVLGSFAVSLAATLGTAPLVALHFHRVQLIGPLANLFIVPFVGVVIGYGAFASILSTFWNTGAIWILALDKYFLRYILEGASLFASSRFSFLPFPHPNGAAIAAYYLVLIALPLLILKRSKPFVALLFFLVAITGMFGVMALTSKTSLKSDIRVTFFDVGQGDCALVEFRDGREIVIDGGPPGNAAFAVEPYLRARGLRKLDAALMTHSDADHLGGIVDMAEDFDFGVVYVPYLTRKSRLYSVFLDRLDSAKMHVKLLSAGDSIPDFPEIFVLWPNSTAVSAAGSLLVGTNEASFVLLLDRNDVEFLFAADIDARTE
ncbi:ComEC/Rec2 family competence protein, partial [bacterium]|nr:ComEC/Rec2 family competence protein [bacterium]